MRINYLCALLALQTVPISVTAQDYVLVTGQTVNVREKPGGQVFTQAYAGDLFELGKRDGNWFAIFMFAGEYRYVHTSVARLADSMPAMPDEATRRQAFVALLRAEDRAVSEADRRIPPNNMSAIDRNIDLQRLLDDKYKLEVFHRYGMVAAHYDPLRLEGIRKGWMP